LVGVRFVGWGLSGGGGFLGGGSWGGFCWGGGVVFFGGGVLGVLGGGFGFIGGWVFCWFVCLGGGGWCVFFFVGGCCVGVWVFFFLGFCCWELFRLFFPVVSIQRLLRPLRSFAPPLFRPSTRFRCPPALFFLSHLRGGQEIPPFALSSP